MGFEITAETGPLDRLPRETRKLLGQVVRKVTFDVEGQAKTNAPVDTGTLYNSIQAKMTGELSGEVAVGAEYGLYVELGTVNMPAQPYLGPAVERVRPVFERAVKKALEQAAE